MWSISDKRLEEETVMIVREQINYLKSPIPWFQAGVDLAAASWLVTRLESRESTRCENGAHLAVGSFFLLTCPFVDAASRCWTMHFAEKWFCVLNGAVTKNRTLKPTCQVRRLSKPKPVCLIYLYSFMFSDKACSFICSLAVLCTWVYFISFVVHAIT